MIKDVAKRKLFTFVCAVSAICFFLGVLLCLLSLTLFHHQFQLDLKHITGDIVAIALSALFLLFMLLIIILSRFALVTRRFNREVSRREEAELGQLKLERSLQQGHKMQAIGTLASGIAHDFNNILFSIMGYAELAQKELSPETRAFKNLGKVSLAAKRGRDLVSRILTFSGQRSHHFALIQLSDVLEQALSLIQPAIPPKIQIHQKISVKYSRIIGDMTQLQQVFVNILMNAVHAMGVQGKVSIRLDALILDAVLIEKYPRLKHERYFSLAIQDTGSGMDEKTLARIFEPFYTTKAVGEGTGLGLSTAHGIIEEHQGNIMVESAVGRGTTFTVLLPAYMEK